ncbi:AI-2E family transporter [Cohnella sp. GCM10012308]|uniref:AI-2E family transporter n=1 Tax=Cohnella sp. GCM10012308 TaxID=3317329 RepID=UPI0036099F6F
MPYAKFFRIILSVIFVLLAIFLLFLDRFMFAPIVRMFDILLLPIALSGFLYYLLRPIVGFLHNRGMKRWLAVTLLYLAFAGLIALFVWLVWPTLRDQTNNFINNAPKVVEDLSDQVQDQTEDGSVVSSVLPESFDLETRISEYAQKAGAWASTYLTSIISVISRAVVLIGVVPVILFFMLKDGRKLEDSLLYLVPRKYKAEGRAALSEIDEALGSFIVSRVVLNIILGGLMYVGFLIIGLPYALLLVLISVVLNFIPYIGAILAAIPVLVVAFMQSPMLALWSLIIILVAQQIQDHILTPIIFGRTMAIHPVTIIVLLLLGGDLAGVLGMLLSIPVYIVVKILFTHIYKLFFQEKVEEIVE